MRGCNFLVGERCEEEFMAENDELILNLSRKLLTLMLNEKIPFEKKIGNMDYLIRLGADVNKQVYGKSIALWAKELGDDDVVKYVKENGGVETEISKEESDELGKQFWNKSGKLKSVKEIKELVLMGADLGINEIKYGQIWKNLSFEEMNEVLKDLPKGYVIEGDVNLGNLDLTELPDFSKIKVKGTFFCHGNQLTTLQGAPREVGEYFWCYNNELRDLKGKPEKIGGEFAVEETVLARIEELEKQKKNNAVMGAMTDKFEM